MSTNEEEISRRLEVVRRTGEATLDLSSLGLTQVPSEVRAMTWIAELDLSRNELTEVPSEIGDLKLLAKLDLSHNRLTTLPEGLARPMFLQSLLVEGNPLESVPPALGKLVDLEAVREAAEAEARAEKRAKLREQDRARLRARLEAKAEAERVAGPRLRERLRGREVSSVQEEAAKLLERVEGGDLDRAKLDLASDLGGLAARKALKRRGKGQDLSRLLGRVHELGVAASRYAAVALTVALAARAIEDDEEPRGWFVALESLIDAMEVPEAEKRVADATEAGASWSDLERWGQEDPVQELNASTRTCIALANAFGCFFPYNSLYEGAAERLACCLGRAIAVAADQTPYSTHYFDCDYFLPRLDWCWVLMVDPPRKVHREARKSIGKLAPGVERILREALSASVLGQPFEVARWVAAGSDLPPVSAKEARP